MRRPVSLWVEGTVVGILDGMRRAREQTRTAAAVTSIIAHHKSEYFNLPTLVGHSEAWKSKYQDDFDTRVSAIMRSEVPFLAMRKEIADWALRYADYQTLSMTDEIKRESFYKDCPYISDELQHHLAECIEHHNELREHWRNLRDSELRRDFGLSEVVFHTATTFALIALFYVSGFCRLRCVYNDEPRGRDWFRPLILSSLIHVEDCYRSKIGLPSLLGDPEAPFHHLALVFLVANGERNPLFAWEDKFRIPHPASVFEMWQKLFRSEGWDRRP